MHCIIVLATLFVTSCYWSTVPANTISPGVLDQLNITLTNSTEPLEPPLNGVRELKWDQPIQLLSRCWCDFTRTPFFDTFDVQAWDRDSVLVHPMPALPESLPLPSEPGAGVLDGNLDASSVPDSELGSNNVPLSLPRRLLGYVVPRRLFRQSPSASGLSNSTSTAIPASTTSSASAVTTTKARGLFHRWLRGGSNKPPAAPSPRQPPRAQTHISNSNPATVTTTSVSLPAEVALTPKPVLRPLFIPSILLRPFTHWRFRWPSSSKTKGKVQDAKLPWLRRRYDLRRYGIGIILDFGWGRGENGGGIGPA